MSDVYLIKNGQGDYLRAIDISGGVWTPHRRFAVRLEHEETVGLLALCRKNGWGGVVVRLVPKKVTP